MASLKPSLKRHTRLAKMKTKTRLHPTRVTQSQQILPTIESIATGTPEQVIRQTDAAQVVANLPHLAQNRARIEKLYGNTRIDTRHLALNLLSEQALAFSQTATLQARMELYKAHAVPLAERVVQKALSRLADLEAIGLIVFVSSTGFIGPGVDTALIEKLGLKRDMARVTVNFMGCAAAMNGIRVAADYVQAHPQRQALVVCLELSSINAVFDNDMNDIIIHSIFGDGCAAVVVGACEAQQASQQGKVVIRDHLSYLVEDTADGITLGVQDHGITCKLSRQLPDYIEAGVGPVIERFLAQHGLSKQQIDLWAVHPGGTRIIQKSQDSLGLSDDQVADSWEILRQYGNMLSASVLFVIERMLLQQAEISRQRQVEVDRQRANLFNHLWNQASQLSGFNYAHLYRAPVSPPLTGLAFSFSPGVGIEGLLFQKFEETPV
jgi:alpha-pyrone synthase